MLEISSSYWQRASSLLALSVKSAGPFHDLPSPGPPRENSPGGDSAADWEFLNPRIHASGCHVHFCEPFQTAAANKNQDGF